MRKKTNKKRAERALEVQALEVRNLFAGIVEPLSGASSDVEESSSVYDPASDLAYAHEILELSGAGQTVAIIDSGIAYDHYALGGGFGENHRVVGGWDFAENDADPYDDGPLGYHGTHIAGIVGSDDVEVPGVAPGADLVALRVFDDLGHSDFDWIEAALAWVHENQDSFEHPITTVNLSVGAGLNAESIPDWTDLEDEFESLAQDGIFVAVAAGNGFREYGVAGLNYPASSPFVVPVSSVNSTGKLSSFSQRHERALAVPGEVINSTVPDYLYGFDGVTDDFSKSSGTSMATPYLAGAGILVQEAFARIGRDDFTTSDIYDQLYDHSDTIYDSVTKADYQRVNLRASLDAILGSEDLIDETPIDETPVVETPGIEVPVTEAPFTDATSITMLGRVESISLLAATDRWFEFEAAESGVMLASKMETEVRVFDGNSRIDTVVQDLSHNSGQSSQFFEVDAGQIYRIHISGSSQETNLQQLVAIDGEDIVVHGDRSDNLYVSLGSSFVVSAQGGRRSVDSGGRLGDKQIDAVDVEQTEHGLMVRIETAGSNLIASRVPNSSRIASSATPSPLNDDSSQSRWVSSSIEIGCGLNETSEALLSEHAADEMFACNENGHRSKTAILPARLIDELYSDGAIKVSTFDSVDLPVEATTSRVEHVSVDQALSSRLNRY